MLVTRGPQMTTEIIGVVLNIWEKNLEQTCIRDKKSKAEGKSKEKKIYSKRLQAPWGRWGKGTLTNSTGHSV